MTSDLYYKKSSKNFTDIIIDDNIQENPLDIQENGLEKIKIIKINEMFENKSEEEPKSIVEKCDDIIEDD